MSFFARLSRNLRISSGQLEVARLSFYLMSPILVMLYVGSNTHEKFNVPGFWPDPHRLNNPPKNVHDIHAEIERMKLARIEKRKRLEEKAKAMGEFREEEEVEESSSPAK
ncbi:hypothetical protein NADFUDRAFT_43270 [Nadsonia fulvescens var. elongata DSM 6958]|uniref:Mitochondrial cytochrome c oxidase assembly factor n=1 Tax=Nadsonia fulvescens var. elongata DSM 6958 TaxID=857566 RepID=A0A1E3PFS2_9ASCO|nr:hypothetical protein NADFUDRAFT_43270 [Nadsonia fulvescens var. elongata DSM 6958]